MADSQQDLDELAERRLAERVEEKVKSRLFAVYGLVGGAALTILGFFGYSVVSDFRTTAHDTATEAAEAAAKTAVAPVVEQAKIEVAELKDQAKLELAQVKAKEDEANALISRVHDRLDALTESLVKGQEQTVRMSEQAAGLRAEMAAKADDIRDKLDAAKLQMDSLAQAIDTQKQRAQGQFADAGTVADLAKLVQKLADQLGDVDAQLHEMALHNNLALAAPPVAQSDLAVKAQNAAQVAAAPPASPTVFFQFAAMSRDDAKAISAALLQRGYVMPGEDQEASAARLKQVRYFFDQDKAAASLLALDAKAVLSQLGFGAVDVDLRDFSNYPGKKPRPGVLELWLGVSK